MPPSCLFRPARANTCGSSHWCLSRSMVGLKQLVRTVHSNLQRSLCRKPLGSLCCASAFGVFVIAQFAYFVDRADRYRQLLPVGMGTCSHVSKWLGCGDPTSAQVTKAGGCRVPRLDGILGCEPLPEGIEGRAPVAGIPVSRELGLENTSCQQQHWWTEETDKVHAVRAHRSYTACTGGFVCLVPPAHQTRRTSFYISRRSERISSAMKHGVSISGLADALQRRG